VPDPNVVGRAPSSWQTSCSPTRRLVEAQPLWRDQAELWQNTLQRMHKRRANPGRARTRDRRFKDEAGPRISVDHIKPTLSARLRSLVQNVPAGSEGSGEGRFLHPTVHQRGGADNFILTNPTVLRKAKETGGQNLLDGLEHLLADLERGRGRLQISMADETAFEVGRTSRRRPARWSERPMQLIRCAGHRAGIGGRS
jgi:polyhydroxyalkanoate synthase